MRLLWTLLAALALASCSAGEDLSAAKAEASRFHRMLDAGRFAEIYRGSARDLRGAASEAQFTALLDAVHRKLGKFRSAPDPGWNVNWNNGDYFVTLSYRSTYERGEAEETLVYRVQGGKPILAGYHIQSNALITG